MSRFEILTDTHKIQVADHQKDQKYVFNKEHSGGNQTSIGTLSKIVHSTDEIALTANTYEHAGIQDVPTEVFDFLDNNGYDTSGARNRYQL